MLTRRLQQATRGSCSCSFQSPVVTRRQQPRHSRCRRDLSTRLCDQCVNCLQLVKVWKSLSLHEMCVCMSVCVTYLFPLTPARYAHWHCLVMAGAEGSFSRTQRVINNRRWVWFNAVAVYKWNFLVASASLLRLWHWLWLRLRHRRPSHAMPGKHSKQSKLKPAWEFCSRIWATEVTECVCLHSVQVCVCVCVQEV